MWMYNRNIGVNDLICDIFPMKYVNTFILGVIQYNSLFEILIKYIMYCACIPIYQQYYASYSNTWRPPSSYFW